MRKARLDKIATSKTWRTKTCRMAQLGIDNLTELRSRGASEPEKPEFWRQTA
jgi:hypothetical protein